MPFVENIYEFPTEGMIQILQILELSDRKELLAKFQIWGFQKFNLLKVGVDSVV